MDKSYEQKYHKLEETNWWFQARKDIIIKLIDKIDKKSKVLEVGCSGGPLIKSLTNIGCPHVYGIDVSESSIQLCKKRGIKTAFVMDGAKTTFDDETFDIIIASDVLEHIKKDRLALSEWRRILTPGGMLIIFVPAFNFLWSEHDIINKHYKRYSRKDLMHTLQKSGFFIKRSSYWNFFLFFPVTITRIFQQILLKKKGKDQLYALNPALNNFLLSLLKLENKYLKRFNFPLGVSVFAVAVKR